MWGGEGGLGGIGGDGGGDSREIVDRQGLG